MNAYPLERGKEMCYLDKGLPEIAVPRFEGERYEAEVPDTPDLAERAQLSIHAITRMLDPKRDYHHVSAQK